MRVYVPLHTRPSFRLTLCGQTLISGQVDCLTQRLDGLLESKDAAQMIKLFSVFGMTPADRSRVKSSLKKKVENPFDGLRRIK